MRYLLCSTSLVMVMLTAAVAQAQTRFQSEAGTGRVVGISGLPSDTGCQSATGTGQVVTVQRDDGGLSGFTLRGSPNGESVVNLPIANDFNSAASYDRAKAAFEGLVKVGNRLKLGMQACGAAGVYSLTSISLVRRPVPRPDPNRPAAAAPLAAQTPAARTGPLDEAGSRAEDGEGAPAGPNTGPVPVRPPAADPLVTGSIVPPRPVEPAARVDDEPRWAFHTYDSRASVDIFQGNRSRIITVECQQDSGRISFLVDDPRGRYPRGSQQSFQLTAGRSFASATGPTSYLEDDEIPQINATVPIDRFYRVLSEIARQGRFVIRTPGGSQPVNVRGAGEAIPRFLAACSTDG